MSEGGVIEFFAEGPCKSRYLSAMKIILDGAAGNVTAYGNLADGKSCFPI